MLSRFVFAFLAFIGLILPATFALALFVAPAHPEPAQPPGCDRTLASATASVAAMQARMKTLGTNAGPEICTATRLYFREDARCHRPVQKRRRPGTRSWPAGC
jgi:hypothetical protein